MRNRPKKIVAEERLCFANNEELRSYYEDKYRTGGYADGGYRVHGIDISAMYHTRRREAALRLLAPSPGDIILDAGCGSGVLAAQIARHCREIHAIDIAANALDPKFLQIPNLKFTGMNIESLPLPDARFDGIVCVETIEHVLTPAKAIAELARVLKPGGRLVLTYPTINQTLMKRWRLAPRIPVSEHLNEWSYKELVEAGRSAGLKALQVEGVAFDFGIVGVLKRLSRAFALGITNASLLIRNCPANSMFVAVRLQK